MRFTDAVDVAGTRRTADGYLVADARAARTGIQLYRGDEVDPENAHGLRDKALVRVYRPEAEVFSRDAWASFAHRPITVGHPKEMVTAETWKDVSVGHTGDEVARDGQFVRVPMMIADAKAIAAIESGDRQLSAGYTCDLAFDAGTTPEGEAYDAIQKNIRANHVAIVKAGRAGAEVRIGDGAIEWGAAPISTLTADERKPEMAENTLRTVVVDGLSVSTTDQGAQAIEKLTKDRDDARKALADAEAKHTEAVKAKDTELAKKDAEIDDLKSKQLDEKALDKKVRDRADLVATAQKIAKDVKVDGLSDADIRKAVIVAKLGDEAVKDKSADYINARFDILAEDAGKASGDPVRDALRTRDTTAANDAAEKALNEANEAQRNAWKPKAAA